MIHTTILLVGIYCSLYFPHLLLCTTMSMWHPPPFMSGYIAASIFHIYYCVLLCLCTEASTPASLHRILSGYIAASIFHIYYCVLLCLCTEASTPASLHALSGNGKLPLIFQPFQEYTISISVCIYIFIPFLPVFIWGCIYIYLFFFLRSSYITKSHLI